MAMDYRRAADTLRKELAAKGYTIRLDMQHKHPRLYIGCKGEEQFVVLSTTANYDQGDLMRMKRQDIARDVLPNLPTPEPSSYEALQRKEPQPMATVVEAPKPDSTGQEFRTYRVKVYVGGRGGSLVVQAPGRIIPTNKKATVFKFANEDKIGLAFGDSGTSPSRMPKGDNLAFHFPRGEVPFAFADKSPDGRAIEVLARMQGGSLVTLKPLPAALFSTEAPSIRKAPKVSEEGFSLEYGSKIIARVNEWLEWAEGNGFEPNITVGNDRRISVEVVERRTRKL